MTALRPYDRLTALLDLEPNWNSYGANRVNPASVAHARMFGKRLPKDFPLPDIAANPTGHAVLTWYLPKGADEIELEFLPSGEVVAKQCETETEYRFTYQNMRRGLEVLNRFLAGGAERWV